MVHFIHSRRSLLGVSHIYRPSQPGNRQEETDFIRWWWVKHSRTGPSVLVQHAKNELFCFMATSVSFVTKSLQEQKPPSLRCISRSIFIILNSTLSLHIHYLVDDCIWRVCFIAMYESLHWVLIFLVLVSQRTTNVMATVSLHISLVQRQIIKCL